jgi:hypothetical protein
MRSPAVTEISSIQRIRSACQVASCSKNALTKCRGGSELSDRIGGGMSARVMRQDADYLGKDDIEVHIWTDRCSYDQPALVIPNLLEIKHLRDYLDSVIKKHPKYFKPRE